MNATRARWVWGALSASLALGACSGVAKVPPGLPPPEYEKPKAPPWPPPDARGEPQPDAGLGAAPPAQPPAETGSAGAFGE